MTRLVAAQESGKADTTLPQDLLAMHHDLEQFFQRLPPDWQDVDLEIVEHTSHHHRSGKDRFNMSPSPSPSSPLNNSPQPVATDPAAHDEHCNYTVDGPGFAQYCILYVHVHYYINQILLYQSFFSSERIPNSEFALQALHKCMHASASITRILEIMAKQCGECNVPLIAFVFANVVHIKLLGYDNDKSYQEFAIFHLQKSVDISKMSINYTYDFELARTFVGLMEQDVQYRLATFHDTNLNDIDLNNIDMHNFKPTTPKTAVATTTLTATTSTTP
jgi:hypothetical protein